MLKKVQIFKALDVEIKKQKGPAAVKEPYRGYHSLKEELSQPGITIVAEVAGGNPLRGQVRENFRASTHAKSLVENGARVLSVATDRFLYFGEDRNLPEVRPLVKVPVLRRDFILEEYQVEESKILGADAIYLVAAMLETDRLAALNKLASSKGLDVVIEVSSEADLARALQAGAEIVCVVGRDLDTWEPSWELAIELVGKVPERQCLRMVEANIQTLEQIQQIEALGVHGIIIGDVLLDEFYPGKRLAQILSGVEVARKPVRSKPKAGAAPDAEADGTGVSTPSRRGSVDSVKASDVQPQGPSGDKELPVAKPPVASKKVEAKIAPKKAASKRPEPKAVPHGVTAEPPAKVATKRPEPKAVPHGVAAEPPAKVASKRPEPKVASKRPEPKAVPHGVAAEPPAKVATKRPEPKSVPPEVRMPATKRPEPKAVSPSAKKADAPKAPAKKASK